MRFALPFLLLSLAAPGCGGDPQLPESITVTSGEARLVVRTQPFSLTLFRGDTALARSPDGALSVGLLPGAAPNFYPNPLDPGTGVLVQPARAISRIEAVGSGYRLTLPTTGSLPATLHLDLAPEPDETFSFKATVESNTPVAQVKLDVIATPDEHYLGLGEYFDGFDHRGKVRDVRFILDGAIESGYNEVHVPVPSYVSTKGYALFFGNREPLTADFASTDDLVHLTVVSSNLSTHLVAAKSPAFAVARVQRLAGLPPLWPAWMFAPMQWRDEDPVTCTVACEQGCKASRTGSDVVLDDARAMRKLGLPGSAIWIDAPWMSAFDNFEFNPIQFPDAKGLIDQLHAMGYQVMTWAAPFINRSDDHKTVCGMLSPPAGGLYDTAAQKGYFVKQANGQPVLIPWRSSMGSLVDFTNPDAFAFWKSLVKRSTDLGVAGYKLDWDEYVLAALGSQRPDFRFADGTTPATEQAIHHLLFHKAHQEALMEAGGAGVVIARSGDADDARYASVVWPGDLDNDFSKTRAPGGPGGKLVVGGLPAAINAAVTLAASAHPHFGSDIGGLRHGQPNKEALGRWIEFGALSTVMQLGGGGDSHNPWDFTLSGDDGIHYDQELLDLYKKYARLHMSLFPYLYSYVKRNSLDGTPIVRAPAIQYPDDPGQLAASHQYFFGEDLLVAPVVDDKARSRAVAIPPGQWVDWWTRQIITGPMMLNANAPFDTLPLYARAGAIIPLLADDVDTLAPATDPGVVTREKRNDQLNVRFFPSGDASFTMEDGTTLGFSARTFSVSSPTVRTYRFEIQWSLLGNQSPASIVRKAGTKIPQSTSLMDWQTGSEGWFYDATSGVLYAKLSGAAEAITVE